LPKSVVWVSQIKTPWRLFPVPEDDIELTLYWTIGLYDTAYEFGLDDYADPAMIRRVLTIMHRHQYRD
jgi:hypothetical protein